MALLPNHRAPDRGSSNVQSAAYDPATQTLEIVLKGGTYRHTGVPQHIFDHLMAANSPGSYYHSTLKGYYPTERVS